MTSIIKVNKKFQENLLLEMVINHINLGYPTFSGGVIKIRNDNMELISFTSKIIPNSLPTTHLKIVKNTNIPSIAISGGQANNFIFFGYSTFEIIGTVGLSTGSPIADLVMDDVNIIAGNGYIYDGEINFTIPTEFIV